MPSLSVVADAPVDGPSTISTLAPANGRKAVSNTQPGFRTREPGTGTDVEGPDGSFCESHAPVASATTITAAGRTFALIVMLLTCTSSNQQLIDAFPDDTAPRS